MAVLAQVLVLLHLIGFAALFGGVLVQLRLRDPEVNATMLHGAWVSVVTGAGLVALAVQARSDLPYAQLAVKLVLALFVVLLVSVNRRFSSIPRGLLALIGTLTLADAGVAVLWH